ncbi:MAG: 1-acyl-sn-glycerol-3-phosphate acyltransferase [Bifidobacteriaceae bacterium]|jgi:1-acyl-sn-glycerol-3-phosphate acyltransferase|nr:1-acyl-sn-glycerol-3-phosphate acyltransferase [Bifidobacteriaceae bacterium]
MSKPPVPLGYKIVIAILAPLSFLMTRRTWRGSENFPAEGGFIAAANHISSFDFLAVVHFLVWLARPPQALAKQSLFDAPVVGAAMRSMKMIPVHRGTASAGRSLAGAEAAIAEGGLVLVYPEGTVTRDPAGWPMRGRPGAVRLALDTGAPLIPVAQWGAQRLLPRGRKFPRVFPRTRVEVQAGPAIDLSDLAAWPDRGAAARVGTERLMRVLTEMVAQLRGQTPPAEPHNQFASKAGS